MQNKSRAFTLIELLVVVLIIGILAAVAVPQYQKAVIKSRYATLKTLTRSIADAEEVVYLSEGSYTNKLDVLGVLPGGKLNTSTETQFDYDWGYCTVKLPFSGEQTAAAGCYHSQLQMSYEIYLLHSPNYPGVKKCVVYNASGTNDARNQLCKAETRASSASTMGTIYWWSYQ